MKVGVGRRRVEGEGRVRVRPKRENDGKEVCVDSTASTRQGSRGGADREKTNLTGPGGRSWRGSGAWGMGGWLLLVVDFWKVLLTVCIPAGDMVALGAARAEVRCSRSDWSADGKLHMHEVDLM